MKSKIAAAVAILALAGCASMSPAEEARQQLNCRSAGDAAVAAMPADHTQAQAAIAWNAANAQCEDRLADYKRGNAQQEAATAGNVLLGIGAFALAVVGIAALAQPQPVTYIVVPGRRR